MKQQIKHFSVVFLFLFSFTALAEIKEVRSMSEALSGIQRTDIVVFDIDNTILEPIQTIGSDQWYEYTLEEYKKDGFDSASAQDRTAKDWALVQYATQVRPVETLTPLLIKNLQDRGVLVITLTARPNDLKPITMNQLESIGVNVESTKALFANGQNKGVLLNDYLKANNLHPARLIFVDDKQKNVKNMDDAFAKREFANINYRYSAADFRVKAFNPKLADYQWNYFIKFGLLLTDKEVEVRMSQSENLGLVL